MRFASSGGRELRWKVHRWVGNAEAEELDVLQMAAPPVLDVGCGPGRHVIALARMGVPALGVDVAPLAVGIARARGAPVLRRSIFGRVPGAGRWGTALLLDGNVGIGGDPEFLLTRIRALLKPRGLVLVEVEPPDCRTERISVRLEGVSGSAFPWAIVAADDLETVAHAGGFDVTDLWSANGRWFACLVR